MESLWTPVSQRDGSFTHPPKLTLHLPLNELVPDIDNKPTKNKSKFYLYVLCVHACAYTSVDLCHSLRGSQRTTSWAALSPRTLPWVLGIELRLLGLEKVPLPAEASCWPQTRFL